MLNVNELETKWLRYKIKSYIPHAIILLSTVVIISIISTVDFDNKEIPKEVVNTTDITTEPITKTDKKEPLIVKKSFIEMKEEASVKKVNINSYEKNEKMVLSPSLDFMKTMNYNSPQYYNNHDNEEDEKKHTKQYIKQPSIKVEEVKEVEVEVVKDNLMSIKRQNTQSDIQHVVTRFKKSNNPALSLFIAKKYYELEDYNQAYNYALITNELNNNIEDSWMIFAKSLVKLNKKSQAIETLEKYVNYSHSSRAKILLDNIKSGKMK